MVNVWHDIDVGKDAPDFVNTVIEIPKDSKLKYELDKDTGLLKLDRFLHSSVHYSGDYGFIPRTLCEDDDPLDVFIISHSSTYPMTLCEVKVLGVMKMVDDGEADDKIIGVHNADPRFSQWDNLEDVPEHFVKELKEFMRTYKRLENKQVDVNEIYGKEEAKKIINESIEIYNKHFGENSE